MWNENSILFHQGQDSHRTIINFKAFFSILFSIIMNEDDSSSEESDTDVIGFRRPKRRTPPRRRYTSLDQQEQQFLTTIEDHGTELLIQHQSLSTVLTSLCTQWIGARNSKRVDLMKALTIASTTIRLEFFLIIIIQTSL